MTIGDYRAIYIIKLISHACLKLALTTRIIKIKISWFLFPPKHYFFFLIFLFETLSFLASVIKKKKMCNALPWAGGFSLETCATLYKCKDYNSKCSKSQNIKFLKLLEFQGALCT